MAEIFSGLRAILSVNGKRIGWCTNVSGSEEITYDEVNVIGDMETHFVPTGKRVTLSASFVRIVNEDLVSVGLRPPATLEDTITWPAMTMQVLDVHGNVVYQAEEVKFRSLSFRVDPRAVVGVDVEFVARRIKSTTEVA